MAIRIYPHRIDRVSEVLFDPAHGVCYRRLDRALKFIDGDDLDGAYWMASLAARAAANDDETALCTQTALLVDELRSSDADRVAVTTRIFSALPRLFAGE